MYRHRLLFSISANSTWNKAFLLKQYTVEDLLCVLLVDPQPQFFSSLCSWLFSHKPPPICFAFSIHLSFLLFHLVSSHFSSPSVFPELLCVCLCVCVVSMRVHGRVALVHVLTLLTENHRRSSVQIILSVWTNRVDPRWDCLQTRIYWM